mmetsp:Transcript_9407/g.29361  ORF Transcript_9407/g.29361 Transcript_9407/m.29361 type:complete len:234 (-) Transcript_9407:224-925(-)
MSSTSSFLPGRGGVRTRTGAAAMRLSTLSMFSATSAGGRTKTVPPKSSSRSSTTSGAAAAATASAASAATGVPMSVMGFLSDAASSTSFSASAAMPLPRALLSPRSFILACLGGREARWARQRVRSTRKKARRQAWAVLSGSPRRLMGHVGAMRTHTGHTARTRATQEAVERAPRRSSAGWTKEKKKEGPDQREQQLHRAVRCASRGASHAETLHAARIYETCDAMPKHSDGV